MTNLECVAALIDKMTQPTFRPLVLFARVHDNDPDADFLILCLNRILRECTCAELAEIACGRPVPASVRTRLLGARRPALALVDEAS